MKNRDVIKALEKDGWTLVRVASSHHHFKKEGVAEIITISGHARDEMTPGELQSARRISGLELRK